jgi:hypothetical protein
MIIYKSANGQFCGPESLGFQSPPQVNYTNTLLNPKKIMDVIRAHLGLGNKIPKNEAQDSPRKERNDRPILRV